MTSRNVKITLDDHKIRHLLWSTSEDLAKKGAESVQARAQRLAPVRTGMLRSMIVVHQLTHDGDATFQVTSEAPYSAYQEWGTGPIYASPGGVLAFKVGGRTVFARHTRGVPATHFMAKAASSISIMDFVA